jgi:hypothetical protein
MPVYVAQLCVCSTHNKSTRSNAPLDVNYHYYYYYYRWSSGDTESVSARDFCCLFVVSIDRMYLWGCVCVSVYFLLPCNTGPSVGQNNTCFDLNRFWIGRLTCIISREIKNLLSSWVLLREVPDFPHKDPGLLRTRGSGRLRLTIPLLQEFFSSEVS